MPGLITIFRLLAQIEENPIEGGKAAQKRHDGVRVANYESSVSAGALYRALKVSPSLVSAFYDQPFWKGDEGKKAYKKNPKNLNKHCHQFVYGARDGSEGKRAEDHASATQSWLDDNDKSIDQILEQLSKKGGFDGLKKEQTATETRSRLKTMEATDRKRSSAGGEAMGGDGAREDSPVPKPTLSGGRSPPEDHLPKMTMKEVFKHLLVTMEPEELGQFLGDRSEIGDRRGIVVERETDHATGRAIWRAIVITPIEE